MWPVGLTVENYTAASSVKFFQLSCGWDLRDVYNSDIFAIQYDNFLPKL